MESNHKFLWRKKPPISNWKKQIAIATAMFGTLISPILQANDLVDWFELNQGQARRSTPNMTRWTMWTDLWIMYSTERQEREITYNVIDRKLVATVVYLNEALNTWWSVTAILWEINKWLAAKGLHQIDIDKYTHLEWSISWKVIQDVITHSYEGIGERQFDIAESSAKAEIKLKLQRDFVDGLYIVLREISLSGEYTHQQSKSWEPVITQNQINWVIDSLNTLIPNAVWWDYRVIATSFGFAVTTKARVDLKAWVWNLRRPWMNWDPWSSTTWLVAGTKVQYQITPTLTAYAEVQRDAALKSTSWWIGISYREWYNQGNAWIVKSPWRETAVALNWQTTYWMPKKWTPRANELFPTKKLRKSDARPDTTRTIPNIATITNRKEWLPDNFTLTPVYNAPVNERTESNEFTLITDWTLTSTEWAECKVFDWNKWSNYQASCAHKKGNRAKISLFPTEYGRTYDPEVKTGNYKAIWKFRTKLAPQDEIDITPDPFLLEPIYNAPVDKWRESNVVDLNNVNQESTINLNNPNFQCRIYDSKTWIWTDYQSPCKFNKGESGQFKAQFRFKPTEYGKSYDLRINIWSFDTTWPFRSESINVTQDRFDFPKSVGLIPGEKVTSQAVQMTGEGTYTWWSLVVPSWVECQISDSSSWFNSTNWQTWSCDHKDGQYAILRTEAPNWNTTATYQVTSWGWTDEWPITTPAQDTTPYVQWSCPTITWAEPNATKTFDWNLEYSQVSTWTPVSIVNWTYAKISSTGATWSFGSSSSTITDKITRFRIQGKAPSTYGTQSEIEFTVWDSTTTCTIESSAPPIIDADIDWTQWSMDEPNQTITDAYISIHWGYNLKWWSVIKYWFKSGQWKVWEPSITSDWKWFFVNLIVTPIWPWDIEDVFFITAKWADWTIYNFTKDVFIVGK